MAGLRQLFPYMQTKYSLTTHQEIAAFKNKASQLAALDYYVSLNSDVFISASPGNMHNALVSVGLHFLLSHLPLRRCVIFLWRCLCLGGLCFRLAIVHMKVLKRRYDLI